MCFCSFSIAFRDPTHKGFLPYLLQLRGTVMSNQTQNVQTQADQTSGPSSVDHKTIALIGYVLMIFGLAPISVIMAYIKRPDASEMFASHWSNMIRVFWIGLALGLAAYIAAFALTAATLGFGALIAWMLPLAVAVWWWYRSIRGLLLLNDGKPYPA
jgi:uncharacterized membrane protein